MRKSSNNRTLLMLFALLMALLLAACTGATEVAPTETETPESEMEEVTPAVTVEDQELTDSTVTVASVTAAEPGWMVIHADDNGAPGQVIGQAAVETGENSDVVVEIDQAAATETLYAMLHVDAGTQGEYEFPGADAPVSVDDSIVVQPFTITGGMDMETDEMMEEEMAEEEMSEEEMEQTDEQAVTIVNFAFSPDELTVPVGTTVVWTNQDNVGHTVTAGSPSAPNPDFFDSGSLSSGDTFSFTFDEAGSFEYYCTIHPSMTATVTVEG
ncbi:MAG: plastocyanin/azurin family copper-binding protein [Candidatus Promineifilaceae bacterium]|nr:plastocyanin/azurin family copper-binding protein [Candidatus Promineifilaceae bacterium]